MFKWRLYEKVSVNYGGKEEILHWNAHQNVIRTSASFLVQ